MKSDRLKTFTTGGVIHVSVRTPRGIEWISTGQTDYPAARRICTKAMLDKLAEARAVEILSAEAAARAAGSRAVSPSLLGEWRLWLEPQVAPATAHRYFREVGCCMKELCYLDRPLSVCSHEALSRWVNVGSRNGRQVRLSSILSFFTYVQHQGYLAGNPARLVSIRLREMTVEERTPKETKPFTEEEYRLLTTSPKVPAIWRSAIVISYWTGLRLKDILCLEWASIRETGLLVYQQKTGDRVEHSFCDCALSSGELKAALEALPRNETPYCFPQYRERILIEVQRTRITDEFIKIARDHGIQGKTFHGWRHSNALLLQEMGRTKEQIAASLGQRSLESTAYYLNHGQPRAEVAVDFGADCI